MQQRFVDDQHQRIHQWVHSTVAFPPADMQCAMNGNTLQQCQDCCFGNHNGGGIKAETLIYSCLCPLCPDCSTLLSCGGSQDMPSTACTACVNQNTQTCIAQEQSQCNSDSDCLAFEACIEGCT